MPVKKVTLIGLLIGAALLSLIWLGLRLLVALPVDLAPVETKLGLMIGLAIFCLVLGALGLEWVWRARHSSATSERGTRSLSLVAIFALVYLIPAVVMVLPGWLKLADHPDRLFGPLGLASGQPGCFIWQVLALSGYLLANSLLSRPTPPSQSDHNPSLRAVPAKQSPYQPGTAAPPSPLAPAQLIAGLLAGLGLWLAAAFIYGLLVSPFSAGDAALSQQPVLRTLGLLVALTLAPWAEERFFRQQLLLAWRPRGLSVLAKHSRGFRIPVGGRKEPPQSKIPRSGVEDPALAGRSRMGALGASLVTAALFATVQARPLLWLPAFLLGLGLAGLVLRTGRLAPAMLAHALFNGLIYLLGWYLVV